MQISGQQTSTFFELRQDSAGSCRIRSRPSVLGAVMLDVYGALDGEQVIESSAGRSCSYPS